ncbi:hypothetical protein Tco_1108354, partial [Tanacetum coccineum]
SRRQLHFLGRDMKTSSLLEVHLDWTYCEEIYDVANAQVFFQSGGTVTIRSVHS